jgi:hypothetical protein
VVGTIFINIYDFNPEIDKELDQTEESLLMEKSPEASESVAAEAEEPVSTQKQEAPADKEEVLVAEQERDVVLVEDADGIAMDEAEVGETEADDVVFAAPQMAKEELAEAAPDIAEKMAPVPEPDAVLAVEAAPSRRQKRAQSKAMTAPSTMGQVSGVVVSAEDMDPLPGASVMVKGIASGYVSDMEGRFTVPAGEEAQTTVVASYVGMVTEEYQLDPEQENRVVMQPDLATLNEVVVVAYDARKEAHPVSAVQKVQLEEEDYYTEFKGAEPVGGIEAYKIYMEKNIRFPAGDTLSKREVVVLKFSVNPDGKLSGVTSLRSPGQAFTEEAIRLLEEGPLWNPAQGENGSTDDEVRMRIVFKK